jgi:hypothetical protein
MFIADDWLVEHGLTFNALFPRLVNIKAVDPRATALSITDGLN